jgi:Tol biopolymer transport system component
MIAFTGKRDGNYDIYTIKPDGSDLKRLTTDPGK